MSHDIKRGEIYYIRRFGETVGSEQQAGRPAIIVSNDINNRHSAVVEACYLTTAPKTELPTHALISATGRPSVALCEQVTNISIDRIGDRIACVQPGEMAAVEAALRVSLGLSDPQPEADADVSGDTAVEIVRLKAQLDALRGMYDALLDKLLYAEET